MKKWLIRCLTVLAMVCLIPGIALNVKAVEYAFTYCIQCKTDKTCDILDTYGNQMLIQSIIRSV